MLIFVSLIASLCFAVLSNIRLIQPQVEEFKDPISYGLANFGDIPFGKTYRGAVIVSDPLDACNSLVHNATQNQSEILIATRGTCDFVDKGLNAQKAGYKLLIVVDDLAENTSEIIMADDGRGAAVKIPCLIISLKDGNKLLEFLTKLQIDNQKAILNVDFPVNKRNKAHVHLGLNLNGADTYAYVHDFHRFWERITDQVKMDLMFDIFECNTCIKPNRNDYDKTLQNCLGGGRYCMEDFFLTNETPIAGKYVLMETVRQLCIFDQNQNDWFRYLKHFKQECFNQLDIEACSYQVIKDQLKIVNKNDVQQCISNSFNISETFNYNNLQHLTQNNTLLDKQLKLGEYAGLVLFPGVVINNITVWGQLKGAYMFEDICASLKNPPQICQDFEVYGESLFVKQKKGTQTEAHHVVLFVGLTLVVFFGVLFFVYRRHAKRRMYIEFAPEINTMVGNYVQFSERPQPTGGV